MYAPFDSPLILELTMPMYMVRVIKVSFFKEKSILFKEKTFFFKEKSFFFKDKSFFFKEK